MKYTITYFAIVGTAAAAFAFSTMESSPQAQPVDPCSIAEIYTMSAYHRRSEGVTRKQAMSDATNDMRYTVAIAYDRYKPIDQIPVNLIGVLADDMKAAARKQCQQLANKG